MDKRVFYRLNPTTNLVERCVDRRFGAQWVGVSAVPMGDLAAFRKRYPNEPIEGTNVGTQPEEPQQESLEELLRRATPEQLEELGYLRVYEGDDDEPEAEEESLFDFESDDED